MSVNDKNIIRICGRYDSGGHGFGRFGQIETTEFWCVGYDSNLGSEEETSGIYVCIFVACTTTMDASPLTQVVQVC